MASLARTQRPWLAFALLVLLFELPSVALPEPVRPTGELVLLLLAWLASRALGLGARRVLSVPLGVCTVVLLVARLDRAIFVGFMGEEPLLYDQLFMLRHLFVLLGDLWSWSVAGVLLAVFALGFALTRIARWALAELRRVLEPGRVPEPRRAAAVILIGCLVGSFLPPGSARAVRWMTPGLWQNARESRRIYQSVQRRVGLSPYRDYSRLKLARKPDVYLFLVESYGRVMAARPELRGEYLKTLRHIERRLRKAGWSSVSGFSAAPVMGGRSWLAEGSVMMGTHVGYEAVFHHLIDQIQRVPNLTSFLAGQGYRTLLLAPSDRKRRGVEDVNYYRFQRCVRFNDIDYRGQQFGWGVIPDQYSLGFTEDRVVRDLPHPFFFDFHMVSSHAPWEEVPPLYPDYRAFDGTHGVPLDDPVHNSSLMRLSRYVHYERRFAYAGSIDRGDVGKRYAGAILYDLELLGRYFESKRDDALVIVMGDHQPPLVAAETRNFDTPIHVLARDPALLAEWKAHGFRDGLRLASTQPTAVRHEALFSLIARVLAGCCGDGSALPAFRPEGVSLGQ